MYRAITDGIQIDVDPAYVPDQSKPEENEYFFSYRIRITNVGERPAQLVSRHWIITDGSGQVREVQGPGVVGQTPKIPPGESFEYASFCPLPTPTGNMRGSFLMRREDRSEFVVRVPLFFLRQMAGLGFPGGGAAGSEMVH